MKKFGVRRECRCWGLQLASKLSQTGDSRRNADCGTRSRQCLICSALGSCCCPRCHHVLRTVPPSQSARYAAGHDEGMFQTMTALLGALPGTEEQITIARDITTLPMRLGGLGLRSAGRTAPGAYWASWADALRMLRDRLPAATEEILAHSSGEPEGCLHELQTASGILDREGFVGRPSWQELRAGARPPPPPLTVDPTTRLPLPNTTFGRPQCLPDHAQATRLT